MASCLYGVTASISRGSRLSTSSKPVHQGVPTGRVSNSGSKPVHQGVQKGLGLMSVPFLVLVQPWEFATSWSKLLGTRCVAPGSHPAEFARTVEANAHSNCTPACGSYGCLRLLAQTPRNSDRAPSSQSCRAQSGSGMLFPLLFCFRTLPYARAPMGVCDPAANSKELDPQFRVPILPSFAAAI